MPRKRAAAGGLLLALAGALFTTTTPASPAVAAGPEDARIFVANATKHSVDLYDANGAPQVSYAVGFKAGDGFLVENVNQDAFPEILVAHRDSGFLDIYSHLGQQISHFDIDFGSGDQLAVGDIDGNSSPDVVVKQRGILETGVEFYAPSGGGSFGGFDLPSGFLSIEFGIGDVNGNGTDEIWVGTAGSLDIYDRHGNQVTGQSNFVFSSGQNRLLVEDVDGNGRDDLVHAIGDGTGRVGTYWFRFPPVGVDNMQGLSSFTSVYGPNMKVATGDLDQDGKNSLVITKPLVGQVVVYDLPSGLPQTELPIALGNDDKLAVAPFADGDIDSDGIPDRIELDGIRNADGTLSMNLVTEGASPCRKDVIVEIDAMAGLVSHNHQPIGAAITEAENAFDRAPVPGVLNCPYPGKAHHDGIHLIVDDTGTIPEKAVFNVPADFVATKADPANFDVARDPYVHYNLWVHNYDDGDGVTGSSGLANFTNDHQDFLVSLGSFNGLVGTTREQSGTLMHELGHSLGLGHGGGDDMNYKPNYLSIMNYSFQTSGFRDGGFTDIGIDYSRFALPQLDAKRLSETVGIGSPTSTRTTWLDSLGRIRFGRGDQPSDWSGDDRDGNGVDDDDGNGVPSTDIPFTAPISAYCVDEGNDNTLDTTTAQGDDVITADRIHSGPNLKCQTTAAVGDDQLGPIGAEQRFLNGFNDWSNLNLRRGTGPGVSPPDEMTADEAEEIQQAQDASTYPDRKILLDAPRPGYRQVVGAVAMDKQYVYATHYYETVAEPHTSDRPGSLVVVDRATLKVKTRIPVGSLPRSVAVNPVTGRIYVLSVKELRVVNRASLAVTTTLPLSTGHVDVAVNSKLNRIYISNWQAGGISIVDGTSNTLRPSIPIGPGPMGLTVDETTNTVWVALQNASFAPFVTALGSVTDHGAAHQIHPKVPLGHVHTQPNDVAVDPVKRRVYVAGLGAAGSVPPNVNVVDANTRQVLKRIDLPMGPARAIAVNPDAHQVFVAGEGRVHVIDDGTLSVVRTIPAALPFSIATDTGAGREIFVGDLHSGEMSRYSYSSGKPN